MMKVSEQKQNVRKTVCYSMLSLLLFVLVGCVALPKTPPREEMHALDSVHPGMLVDASENVLAGVNPGESAFMLLQDNAAAMKWRLALIDHATTSIDLQYFIWDDDEAGRLLLNRLTQAARRGVRVRLLVDDFPVRSSDEDLAMLARQEHFNLRLFNPTRVRRGVIGPLMEMVIYFKELNRRMHNKLMIVDGRWAIIGGRNIGNHYFGLDKKYNFRDLDILIAGPLLADLEHAFDEYWNSEPAYPGELMASPANEVHQRKLVRRMEKQVQKDSSVLASSGYPVARVDWTDYFASLTNRMVSGTATYLQDQPIVSGDRGERLSSIIPNPNSRIQQRAYVVSPYLIPPSSIFGPLEDATGKGVEVTFLTSSLGANNHTITHSHYQKYRRKLLASGADLYEFRHDPTEPLRTISDVYPVESKFISLHIKATVVDDKRVYLGSLNLDPRALQINTENVIVIDSEPLAEQMASVIETMLADGNSWQVYTNEDGWLRWKSGDDVRRTEPARTLWQRFSDYFCRLLPVESQL